MRLGVLKELKHLQYYIDFMHKRVKNRDEEMTQRAYIFLKHMAKLMDDGVLSHERITFELELTRLKESEE